MADSVETIKLAGNSCAVSSSREPTFSPGLIDEETFSQEAPETLTPQEKDEKRGILRRISKYRALFSVECADLDLEPRALDALNLEDLRDRARDTEYLVSTRRSAAAMRGMFLGALATGEIVSPVVGLNLTGLLAWGGTHEKKI